MVLGWLREFRNLWVLALFSLKTEHDGNDLYSDQNNCVFKQSEHTVIPINILAAVLL